ncbi:MAG: M14 family zinc carboxypeptidase [Thermoplasmatota archaeon]
MKKVAISVVVVLLLLPAIVPVMTQAERRDDVSMLLRVPHSTIDEIVLKYAEIVGGSPDKYLDIIIPSNKCSLLDELQIPYEILIDDLDKVSSDTTGQYHTFEEMQTMLQYVASSFPSITSLQSIGRSYEDNDIWCLEISDNPGTDEKEPGVFFMGVHHAREWPTMEICLRLIETLTTSYENDTAIADLVNNRRIWIVPCVNPDGFIYDHDENAGSQWWRKNRHYFEEFDTFGVDLNRNYGGSCNGDPVSMWGSTGMSHAPADELYCGKEPFSEVETQAIRNMFLTKDICATISWHTYSELVMWPWGYTGESVTPDDTYMSQIGREIASRITSQDGSGTYTPTQSAGLYPTTGDTTDWAYGYYHYVLGKPLFAYTIEACESFHPDDAVLDQVCKENVEGALYLLYEAGNISSKVVPRVLPPVMKEVNIEPDGSFTICWDQKNPLAEVTKYRLEELSNMFVYTDSCEVNEGVWVFDGFSKTDKRAYSGTMSYSSGKKNDAVSCMTLQDPLYVEPGMDISFQCSYDIEENYDMACVEISTDGRFYEVLDTFTGSSGGWVSKSYDIERYASTSIFIRFRYATDSQTIGDGFFVDDITPVSDFRSIVTLSESISSESFEIASRSDGTYYYRVRGFNEEHGWCDDSTLVKVEVDMNNNHPPDRPTLSGVKKGKTGESYQYSIMSIDANDDPLYYYISWGDGTIDEWIGPYASNEQINMEHVWQEKGDYIIKVRAKDSHQRMGEWSTLPVTMPRHLMTLNRLFDSLTFHRFFHLFPFF